MLGKLTVGHKPTAADKLAQVPFKGKVNLRVPASVAKPSPSLGQALGPLGLNMNDFCKEFNEATSKFTPEVPIPVALTAFADRTFTFTIKSPPSSWLILKAAGLEKGASSPGNEIAGTVDFRALYEIAKLKQKIDPQLQDQSLEGLCRTLASTCRSMGIKPVRVSHEEKF